MNLKLTAILTAALLCGAAASSCGKDKESSSEVILDIKTTAPSTEPASETGEVSTTSAVTTDKKTTATTSAAKQETTTTAPEDAEDPTEPDEPATDEPDVTEEPDVSEPEPEPTEAPTEAPKPKKDSFSIYDIDQPMSGFIGALGDSYILSEAEACIPKGDAGDILFVYEYQDVKFECYSSGGTHYAYNITIKGGNFSTDNGIRVGSSRADVTAAYGSLDSFGGDLISSGADSEIYFVMDGDTVAEIQINSI